MQPKDGTVSLALGFGRVIAEGGKVYRYSPAYPKKPPPYAGPREFLEKLQNSFYALDMQNTADAWLNCTNDNDQLQPINESICYTMLPLSQAQDDAAFKYIASTYSAENDRIIDNVNIKGAKIITFAPIIKQNRIKLNDIVKDILSTGKQAFGCDVEIEFAVNI